MEPRESRAASRPNRSTTGNSDAQQGPVTMFVFLFCAHSAATGNRLSRLQPADVYCWIRGEDPRRAQLQARGLIREAGWRPSALLDARRAERSDYEGGVEEPLQYYDEALETGATLVILLRDALDAAPCPVYVDRIH